MRIAKSAKRLLSALTVTTLLVSGIVVAPKAKAAGKAPTVTLKGATVKIAGNAEDSLSMRIGVEVTNASNAKECGVQLQCGDKTTTISTANADYQKIYDVDEAQDKIIYTVVIKNIPSTEFATNIKVIGTTKACDSDTEIKTAQETKTIKSVVSAAGLELKANKVVKLVESLDVSKNLTQKCDDWPWGFGIMYDKALHGEDDKNPDQKIDGLETVTATTEDGCLKIVGREGIAYKRGGNPELGNCIISVEAKCTEGVKLGLKAAWTANTEDIKTATGDWQEFIISHNYTNVWEPIIFRSDVMNSIKNVEYKDAYYVKSFKIYQPLTDNEVWDTKLKKDVNMTLSKDTADNKADYFIDPANSTYNNDGSVSFTLPKAGNKAAGFWLDASKSATLFGGDYYKVIVTISTANIDVGKKVCLRMGPATDAKLASEDKYLKNFELTEANKDYEIENEQFSATMTPSTQILGFFIQNRGWEGDTTAEPVITIKSVKFVAK